MTSNHCWRCSGGIFFLGRGALGVIVCLLLFVLAKPAMALAQSGPFDVDVEELEGVQPQRIKMRVSIPARHHIYAESWRVRSEDGQDWKAVEVPRPARVFDPFSEEEKDVYETDFTAVYEWTGAAPAGEVVVEWQGCDDRVCFFPETKRFELHPSPAALAKSAPISASGGEAVSRDWRSLANRFEVAGRYAGYLGAEEFLAFLDEAVSGRAGEDAFARRLRRAGPWVGGLLILLGGLALNLTPCVLPMLPVNLAIIGAGARAGSKARGFLLGSVYGLGMALAYGALGIIAVATGSTFGALNASPWFNAAIAILFVVLALAAFEVILIDFSRFQPAGTSRAGATTHLGMVFFLGVVSALLAGACVAPVVISVLLLTSALYSKGMVLAVLLPFLLGAGMALPWPLAGAGLALLPRPGPWMKWVNRLFGVFILALAIYYGHNAWQLFKAAPDDGAGAPDAALVLDPETEKLSAALEKALREKRPVFIDFWATWCKNCVAMEKTTFRDPDVIARLKDFVVVKYQAEHPDAPGTKPILQFFGVGGLPTYIVLKPHQQGEQVP